MGLVFSLTTFRVRSSFDTAHVQRDSGSNNDLCNDTTRKVYHIANASSKAFVTGCEVEDLYVIRIVASNIDSSLSALENMFNGLVVAAESIKERSS
jgi:hypothetical protein